LKNELPTKVALWIGAMTGLVVGVLTEDYISERKFSKYTLNCIEQNMSLKQMAFERFTNDYKLRFNDWNRTSTPSTLSTPKAEK
jgi:hypothetical protein